MKTINNIKFLSVLFFLGLIVSSCVQDDDFDTPEVIFEEPNVNVNTTIAAIKSLYTGGNPTLISGEGEMYFEGYVISSDETGNFYKTLVIQDKPENPTAGISISTESTNMYTFFEPGRKVYVRVDGLYSGVYNGLPTLGASDGTQNVARMSIVEFEDRVLRSNTIQNIVPRVKTFGTVNDNDLNILMAFENVQVSDQDLGQPYANLNNTFSVNRIMTNCERTESMIMRNSGFADFKNEIMPTGSGTLTAVMSVFNSDYQVFIRDTDDLNFDQDRCEEIIEEIIVGLPFNENFEGTTAGTGAVISLPGWRNASVAGTRKFESREFDNNKYAQITAFNSGEPVVETWLVTPGIDLGGADNPILTFKTKDGHNNGNGLKVYVSTNLSGSTVENATWTEISATIASGTTTGYANNFTDSGEINLSAYTGQVVHIGFQYLGGDGGITTTYQIDDINVAEGSGGGGSNDLPFLENFEGLPTTGVGVLINLPGWTNANVSGGQRRYEAREFSNNKYAQITAFNSGESTVEAWLVTPGVSLDGAASPKLTFRTKDGHNNGNGLKVFVSTDFSGNAANATWTELNATIASGTSTGYADNFTDSGQIDLSGYSGQTVYIGFQYLGGNDGITTTYQIDDVHIFE